MLKVKQMQLKVILDKEDSDNLVENLGENFDLVLYGMKKDYIERLGLSLENENKFIREKLYPRDSNLLGGDLVYLEPDTLMYYKIHGAHDALEIGIIGDTDREEFESFANQIKESILDALDDPDTEWEPVKKLDPSFDLLIKKAKNIMPTQEEISASVELSNPGVRELMKIINKQDSIFMDKLFEQVKLENIEEIVKKLQDSGLVTSDFALLCSKTGQQILKVPDRLALDDISKTGFRCFICGNSIADEKLIRSISCSGFGKKILENDHWLLIIALHTLNEIEIPYDEMFIIADESLNTKIFLNINDESMMIQLTNRKLSMDDVYFINAHIAAYKINYFVLVSTDTLSLLMKSHLKETNPECDISFVDGLEFLGSSIQSIMVEKEKKRLLNIFKEMTTLTPLPMDDLLMKKLVPDGIMKPESGLEGTLSTKSSAKDPLAIPGKDVEDEIIEGVEEEAIIEPV